MTYLFNTKSRKELIQHFPEYFQEYLADPNFADICKKDPELITACFESFEDELKNQFYEAKQKINFDFGTTVKEVKNNTGRLRAFIYFLQSKFSGKFLDTAIVIFFEEKIANMETDKDKVSLAILYAIALCNNPTVDIGLIKRIEIAVFDQSSDRFALLKKSIKSRLERGY